MIHNDSIIVSIICNTYNQHTYIEDAIKGFLMQKTTFLYEVLIHDDASTDGTTEIIKKYEKMKPDIIKPIYQKINKYSQNINIIQTYQYPRVKGKYVAFCEGDDFWTDEYKLQKQYEVLEKHPEINMCAHKSAVVEADTLKFIKYTAPLNKNGIISTNMIINSHGNRIVDTATLFYRSTLCNETPKFVEMLFMDTTMRIQGSLRGGIYYLDECMSCYRWLSKGSWTSNSINNIEKSHNLRKKMVEMYTQLNIDTDYKYSDAVEQEINEIMFNDIYSCGDCRELNYLKYANIKKSLSVNKRVKLFIKQIFPFINRYKSRHFYEK